MLFLAQLLALAALIALGLAIVIVVRRATKLVNETRETERFRRRVADLSARMETSLEGVTTRIDGVRRQSLPAESIIPNLEAASDAVARYTEEAKTLRGTAGAVEIREAIVLELDRAARALQMVEHGCTILASARIGGRELEAQTAIKRGYLNVLHAREALARHAIKAAEVKESDEARFFARRNA
ncbi:MAG: hypothetical protein ACJ77B_02660 [Chloroflexota bacterium]